MTLATLIQALRSSGRALPGPLIAYVARELCGALQTVHLRASREHVDVTPFNIVLSVGGQVQVSRRNPWPADSLGGVALEYLSPERLTGEHADRRSDVYAVAITMCTLALARPIFWRPSPAATIHAVRNEPLPDLARLRPDLPLVLVAALTRAAQKDPQKRFASLAAFRSALHVPEDFRGDVALRTYVV